MCRIYFYVHGSMCERAPSSETNKQKLAVGILLINWAALESLLSGYSLQGTLVSTTVTCKIYLQSFDKGLLFASILLHALLFMYIDSRILFYLFSINYRNSKKYILPTELLKSIPFMRGE